MLYPIPYLVLYAVLGIMSILVHQHRDDNNYRQHLYWGGFVICVIFFGLRGFVFHDWMNYYPSFEKTTFYELQHYDITQSTEIGWLIFRLICKGILDDYHFMVFVHSVICLLLLFNFLKQYIGNVLLGMCIYLMFDGFTLSINLMRNCLAMMIFLNALPFLQKRRPIQYVGLCILAACFHFSALAFIPLYFFIYRKTSKWLFVGIYLSGLAIYMSSTSIFLPIIKALGVGGDFIDHKIDAYTNLSIKLKLNIGLAERLLTGGLIFCYYDKIQAIKEENRMFINVFIVYILSVFLISEFSEVSKRISILFVFCYWVLWPSIIKCFYYSNNRLLFISFVVLYGALKISAPIINQPVCEYDNILLGGIKSYPERKSIFERTFVQEE